LADKLNKGQASGAGEAKGMPLVSICMPTYKRTNFVREALDSALAQTYMNIEILVSDDSPSNNIGDIVRSYASPRVRYQLNAPALGFVPKLNSFLNAARGEWMVILCDDDILDPDYVSSMMANARKHPEGAIHRSRNMWIDVESKMIQLDPLSPVVSAPSRFLHDLYLPQSETFRVNLSGFMFRPSALKALGGFTELYAARHLDRLAWSELATLGPVICEERPLCKIRLHGTSVSSELESRFDDAVAATQTAGGKILEILDRVDSDTQTDTGRGEVATARQLVVRYSNEHISRAFRQALLTELMRPGGAREDLKDLRGKWVRLGLPTTRLTQLLLAASWLPAFLRKPLVSSMLRVRQKKLQ